MRVVRRKSCSHIMLLVVSSGKRLKNRFLTAKLLPPTESTSVRPQVLQAFLLHLAALTLCYKECRTLSVLLHRIMIRL